MGLQVENKEMNVDEGDDRGIDCSSKDLCTVPSDILNKSNIRKLYLDYNEITKLPEQIAESLPKLQVLSVNGNRLRELPKLFGELEFLQELLLNENEITHLPVSLNKLKSLEILKLTGNKLKFLPDDFGEIPNLKIFYVDENELEKLPSTFGLLNKLEILELADNFIENIPVGIGQLKNLKILNLCNNKLTCIPSTFGDLANLENVDLSRNKIEHLPSYCNSVDTLKKFYMDRNNLADIPDWVCELSQVTELSLKDNKLQGQALLGNFGENCRNVKLLDFGGNFMNKLPDSIGNLLSLEKIYLGSVIGELERRAFQNGNWLTLIPDSFCNLINLKEIRLDENHLTELPAEFGNLINLENIDLGQNYLHELPESFGNLKSLKICLLSKNQLQLLPSTFGNLTSLEDLRLDNNLLAELPESFCQLTNLKTLDLFFNRLTEIPSALNCFNKLVRLDLDDNDFKLPWYEVPQIVTKSKYPERDPKLKDNWRGRPRQDLSMMEEQIIHVEGGEVEEEEEPEESQSSRFYNEELYRRACQRNMSIWRSHGGPQKREKFIRKQMYHSYVKEDLKSQSGSDTSDESYKTSDDESVNEDDEFEPPIFGAKLPGQKAENEEVKKEVITSGSDLIQSEENWDDEIEEVEEYTPYENFNDIYQHPAPRTLADAGYTVDSHLFLPYDIHNQPIRKQAVSFTTEMGQFEDVSDEES